MTLLMNSAWHSLASDEVARLLDTDAGAGLSPAEAARRLAEDGPNLLQTDDGPGRLAILADQFRDVLVWVLIAAAAVSGILLDEWIDTGVIMAIVVLNALIGYVQEARAEDALARLKEIAAPEATVLRGGDEAVVPGADLVAGDVILLEAGDRVPADARVVTGVHLEVDEAALTGESLPSGKSGDAVDQGSGLGDRRSMVFAATTVSAGRGTAVVTGIGAGTEVARIADLLAEEELPTPLQTELAKVGRRLAVLAVGTAAIVFGAGMLRGNPAEAMVLTAVALAVAAIPEGLTAIVTITLSRGVQRMAKENAIVRRLPAVEALGSATVICTDKTGTLTRNEMAVTEVVLAGERRKPSECDPDDARVRRYLEVASLANDARVNPDGGHIGDPTEVALLSAVADAGVDSGALRDSLPRVDEAAFDSRRKRMSTLHQVGGSWLLLVKGAPEVVVGVCSMVEETAGPVPLGPERRERANALAAGLAERGLRTLALAYRMLEERPASLAAAEEALVLVAIVGMSDEAREEAAPAVAEAQQAGIKVVMVTGDHAVTAAAIASEVGIHSEGDLVMSGDELSLLSVDELAARVHAYSVYARVDPVDKVKIVRAWQAAGEIVAMTGDGINDAPALRNADIGVAMGTGTDVAKDAADMVLADDNFATIISAVRQGRGIFANLKKVVYFLLSSNASEVLVMLLGFLIFGSLGEPLVAVQLLWINLVTDGLPAVALGFDPPGDGIMGTLPDRQRDILSGTRQVRLLGYGAVLAAATLLALVVGHYLRDLDWPEVQTSVFTVLVIVQLLHAFNVRTPNSSVWRGCGRNRALSMAVAASLIIHLVVIYTPIGGRLFDTVPPDAIDWLWMAAIALVCFALVDRLKGLLRMPGEV